MPTIDAVVSTPVCDSFRVQSIGGMFDVPLSEKMTSQFCVEVPEADEDWQVGVIMGRSGSGKTTIARQAFGDQMLRPQRWSKAKAIIDGFPARKSVREVVQALISVGLSSPPAWCKPYHILSKGEQFRADLARAFLRSGQLLVIDEFTSVIDRQTAICACIALRKAIDRQRLGKKLVAVTCHDDILPWLQPDWVLDMETTKLTRGRLRQPQRTFELQSCQRRYWDLFAPHHYLDGKLNPAARCFLAKVDDQVAGFVAMLNNFRKHSYRISRIVVLPQFQGMGIGSATMDSVADYLTRDENASLVTISGSHPAIIHHANHSPLWEFCQVRKIGCKPSGIFREHTNWKTSYGRATASFRYLQPK